MSATVMSDSMAISSPESQTGNAKLADQIQTEVEFAKCDCCGLTEECTIAYIGRIRERYQGKWICGLCAEAVKDEIARRGKLISADEALTRHKNFLQKFNSSSPPSNPTVHLISAMRQILRRGLESSPRSMPSSPTNKNKREIDRLVLSRSESCFAKLSSVDSASYHGITEGNE